METDVGRRVENRTEINIDRYIIRNILQGFLSLSLSLGGLPFSRGIRQNSRLVVASE